ncbi:hypothetical protein [Clostridium perfringens]|uniref:hypothetical protein n=1 Tax=Clostridium perfringens TaxID=1502 RepID=UPI0024BC44F7|nr:hypothetical protein [Clostridium perfringens]
MDYKFISLEEYEDFTTSWRKREVPEGIYVLEKKKCYMVIDNKSLKVKHFKTIEGCEKYIKGEMTAEEVRTWEEKRYKRQEKLTYILYYLLIFSMVLFLLYLIKI